MKNWQDDRNYRKSRQPDGTVKNLIFVDGQAVEVTGKVFAAYSQMDRQERYQEEQREDMVLSLEQFAEDNMQLEFLISDYVPSAEETVLAAETEQAQQALLRLLPKAMEQLTEAERELIRALYVDNVPVREYARQKGVRLFVIQKRRDRILAKLKKYFKKFVILGWSPPCFFGRTVKGLIPQPDFPPSEP